MATDTGPNMLEELSILPGRSSGGRLFNTSVDFTVNRVDKELHSAFSDSAFGYDSGEDKFSPKSAATNEDKEVFEYQAFKDELQKLVEAIRPSENTGRNLIDNYTWNDVIRQAEIAREEYRGDEKKGIMKNIKDGFKNYTIAATPAIEAWLRLLPSTSIYGSVVCGGLTIILEAAVRLRKLSKETAEALDQIPYRVETAQFLMSTYECAVIEAHAANLYQAIIEALQHILMWYKRKAGVEYLKSVAKGAAYASILNEKMKIVEKASQAIDDRAELNQHRRLEEIRALTYQTMQHQKEMRDLQLEARNSLYAIFKDKEAWQRIQSWASSEDGKRSRRSTINQQERRIAARNSLLRLLGYDRDVISRNVDDAIRQVPSFKIVDQDRAQAIVLDPAVSKWIEQTDSGALLVDGNCRRHEAISPTTVASATLVRLFKNKLHFIALHWFCGSNQSGSNGNALGMMRSLVCQMLSGASFICDFDLDSRVDGGDLGALLKLFKKLVRELPAGSVVICIIDGISWYDDRRQRDDTFKILRTIVKLMRVKELTLKLLLTSPTRMNCLHDDPDIAKQIQIVEIPEHISGSKQGFNHLTLNKATEKRIRRFSQSSAIGAGGD